MATQKKLSKGKLRVRMYRVGFGDCFLMSVPTRSGHEHVLVDCGVHARGDIKVMDKVIDQIFAETGGKLAVVIASHAHQDHISGFGAFIEKWEKFDVGEVWLPWLEDPKDKDAKKLRQKRLALAESLRQHFAAVGAKPHVEDILVNATGVTMAGMAAAGGTNAKAMDLLLSGFRDKATVKFLTAGEEIRNAAGVKGLNARILAPSRDDSFLGRMDPPKQERFFRMAAHGATVEGGLPFDDHWVMGDPPAGFDLLTKEEEKSLHAALAMPMDAFALALDKVLNNTSLVVAFRFADDLLLFPGDAQWGNWQSWIENDEDVLKNVTFYKVAHHGSHNATPKSALEGMTEKRFAAMASTQSVPWDSIPAPKLVDALKKRSGDQYIQSDSIAVKGAPNRKVTKVPSKFAVGPLWCDYVK